MPRQSPPRVPEALRARQRLGERLRSLREAKGLTQDELGQPHYDRRFVSAVERADASPSFGALVHFARRLETTLSNLLRGV